MWPLRLGLPAVTEIALREAHFTVNRNSIPYDKNGPWYTSGIRMGTAALTTLGMKEGEMRLIADLIVDLLRATKPAVAEKGGEMSRAKVEIEPNALGSVKYRVAELLHAFPLYPELVID